MHMDEIKTIKEKNDSWMISKKGLFETQIYSYGRL